MGDKKIIGKCDNRQVVVNYVDQPLDVKGVAEIVTRHITGGDYAGYIRKVAEKKKQEKE
ncbi:hypothetical protein [Dehalobacter restrictus]|uniref:Uncharacterized protein n=1 Tax=Dehalobacter restrictus TaxID=55583 RepID=A0A857DMR5_9FIRM|nr:hypothetical protein [Dehalobacter restrictus]QHA01669.1 hypothetical protein GQ588_13970 [Dehalobacter restrictus]